MTSVDSMGEATSNNRERFVTADQVARWKGWSGDSTGRFSQIDTNATSAPWFYALPRDLVSSGFDRAPQPLMNLEPYAGQWVVISQQQIAEYGPVLAEVVARARRRGVQKPFVVFVERLKGGVARLSL